MKFETWLLKQVGRDDPIGDLAVDFKRQKDSLRCDEENLRKHKACKEAFEALKDAKEEYKSRKNGTA
jgi:hypothetical protein